MRNSGKGLLRRLILIVAVMPLATAFAATSVTGIDHAATADGGVRITLQIDGDDPQVSVFATESPARIVLDLAETTSEAGSGPVYVGQGLVEQYEAIAAGGSMRSQPRAARSCSTWCADQTWWWRTSAPAPWTAWATATTTT